MGVIYSDDNMISGFIGIIHAPDNFFYIAAVAKPRVVYNLLESIALQNDVEMLKLSSRKELYLRVANRRIFIFLQ